jgi:hypothetical protein
VSSVVSVIPSIYSWIPFVSSVVSTGFPFVVKVEALPLL